MPVFFDSLNCIYVKYLVPYFSTRFANIILHEDTFMLFNLNFFDILRFMLFFMVISMIVRLLIIVFD